MSGASSLLLDTKRVKNVSPGSVGHLSSLECVNCPDLDAEVWNPTCTFHAHITCHKSQLLSPSCIHLSSPGSEAHRQKYSFYCAYLQRICISSAHVGYFRCKLQYEHPRLWQCSRCPALCKGMQLDTLVCWTAAGNSAKSKETEADLYKCVAQKVQ